MSFPIFGCEKTFLRLNCCQNGGPRRTSATEKQLFNLPARAAEGTEFRVDVEFFSAIGAECKLLAG